MGKQHNFLLLLGRREGSSERGHDESGSADVLLDTKCMSLHGTYWIKGDRTAEKNFRRRNKITCTPWQALGWELKPNSFPMEALQRGTTLLSQKEGNETWVHSGLNWLAVMSLEQDSECSFAPSDYAPPSLFSSVPRSLENRDWGWGKGCVYFFLSISFDLQHYFPH